MDSYFSLVNVVAAAISFLALLGTIFFLFLNKKSRSHQENKTTSSSLSLLSPPTSLPSHNRKHHVFPSFHGPDVRKAFLSHVLKEFNSKGIDAFVDNDMERGKSIGPELKEAIRGSRVAIVLLSKNYASSTWCLSELVEIMECREKLDQKVIPIFYEVDPTNIKKQIGDFGKVFKQTCEGKTKKEIRSWKLALTEVAQITGHHSTNWENDAKMIEDIATDVSKKLNNSTPSNDFDSLVGMESQMTKMGPLLQLDSDEVRTIGILGSSGIGKTTIARYLFNRLSPDFQLSVFMESIKTIPTCSDYYSVKLDLQKQFMSQLTNEVGIKIPHQGIAKDRLKDKKILVVLDDVNRSVQLEAMAKETWFGHGSRIIITTQDQKILKEGGIKHIYRADLPSHAKALQMFCMYAFGQKYPKYGFTELASEVMSIVGRLPLGLRVMGSHFRGMCKEDWTKELPSLKTRLDREGEIESILKFSYDALHDEHKRLFLHIACFFKDERVDLVESCLASCFLDVTQGLHILAEKSLISIDSEDDSIEMQELLVRLGRNIVQAQSTDEPGKRQFLVDKIDIDDVLNDDKADSSSVLGINDFYGNITCTSERAFEKLSNLRFLKIRSIGVNPRSLNSISGKLRYLSWWNFGMPHFPSGFNPKFLVKLDMWGSKLEKLWEETQPLSNLKWMDLRNSESLEELPDLSSATTLYDLKLTGCSSLVKLSSSIGNAINLQYLSIGDCSSLVEIPSSITTITNLKFSKLNGCSSLVELPFNIEIRTIGSDTDLSHCSSLVKLPSSIGNAINLSGLDLSYCSSLVKLPSSIGNAIKLTKLNLSYCSSLVELPFSIGNAINLQELYLSDCSSLVELPSSMKNLRRLSTLELSGCTKLEVLLDNINLESFKVLDLSGCSLLKSYPESSTNIQDLKPSGTTVKEVPSSMRSWPLLCEIRELGPWIGRIICLRRLVLSGMKNMVALPQLPYSVVELEADNCESLERLDCSFRNPDIRLLNFGNCFRLNQESRDLIIQTPTNQYAVLPGGKVPHCFTYRSSGGSLTVKLNQKPLGTLTKFKVCIICAGKVEKSVENLGKANVYCNIKSKENALTSIKAIGQVFPGNLYTFEVEIVDVTSTELVFEFMIYSPDLDVEREIKECGINYSSPSRDNHFREMKEVEMDKGAWMRKRPLMILSRIDSEASASSAERDISEPPSSVMGYKEEKKIAVWENLLKAKAEAAMRKPEVKLEKKISALMDKILNKLQTAKNKTGIIKSPETP